MFQDFEPHVYCNEFIDKKASETDYVLILNNNTILLEYINCDWSIPQYGAIAPDFIKAVKDLIYLFSIDETAFYLSLCDITESDKFKYQDVYIFRDMKPFWLAFAGATAYHLALWYDGHRFCGKCAGPLLRKTDERAVFCPNCGSVEYPKISPVVIIGIIDGERILLAKNRTGYKKYA